MKRPPPATPAVESFDLTALNPRQREAVLHEGGPLLVLAGAGSGKTRVIVYRIVRLLRDGVPPERILGLTFTNKAAREMRERLARLVGADASRVRLSTFHSLGLAILEQEHEVAGLRAGFCIYDTADQLGLVRELLRQVRVADRRLDAHRLLAILLKTKRERRSEVAIDWGDDYELAAYDLYPRYCDQMRAFNAIDFDDLILRAEDVLRADGPRERWGTAFEHILVDEYQDTSDDQLELLQALAGPARNVCAVGDDDQSIYAWRGAVAGNILAFEKHFPGAREVVLDQNYRSTRHILQAANAVIANNAARKPKVLWSALGDGDPVVIVTCADDEDEAALVAETIGRLCYDGVRHEDIAVLYRANAQSQIFEETLALEHIPFRVVGGQAFFDRKEVRDALACLAVVHNPRDEIALRRIINTPPRGIGPASVERLVRYGEAHGHGLWWALTHAERVPEMPAAAVTGSRMLIGVLGPWVTRARRLTADELVAWAGSLFEQLGLRQAILEGNDSPTVAARRLENLDEVTRALGRWAATAPPGPGALAGFLRAAALVRSADEEETSATGQVTLMTLHAAKGLEFPYVFMVGLEEDWLPHRRSLELAEGDLGEERRLCYVGMTRARRRLWLTYARRRRKHGKLVERTPSRFLQEIPEGPGVLRQSREAAGVDPERADALATEFFQKMRAQLGIEEA